MLLSYSLDFNYTNCPATFAQAGIKFSYNADANNSHYMANTGHVRGSLLGISDAADTAAIASGTTLSSGIDAADHSALVQAKVNAYRAAGLVHEGAISSVSQVIVVYQ